MFLIGTVMRSAELFLALMLMQSDLKVRNKKLLPYAFFLYAVLDYSVFWRGYIGFLSAVFLIYLIDKVFYEEDKGKSIVKLGIIMYFGYLSRMIVGTYYLLFHKEPFTYPFLNGFREPRLVICSAVLFFFMIWVQIFVNKHIKTNYGVNDKQLVRLAYLDSILFLPVYLLVNILHRYLILHLHQITKIDRLSVIFLIYFIVSVFIGFLFLYLMNILSLSGRKYRIMQSEAEYDELTGVYNRKFGMKKLKQIYGENQVTKTNMVLCFLDINNLKTVNDRFGHPEGDLLISTVSRCARESLRNADFMVRYGGDEFIIVFQNCGAPEAVKAWTRIGAKFEYMNFASGIPYDIAVSVGFSSMDEDENLSIQELIDLADSRMYENKKRMKERIGG